MESDMTKEFYPKMITDLPEADIPFRGVKGWLFQGIERQAVFFDIEPIGEVSEHSHGEQWGFVIEGEMELTISGVKKVYRKGDHYHIPAGAPHSAVFKTQAKVVDVFADVNRYRARVKA